MCARGALCCPSRRARNILAYYIYVCSCPWGLCIPCCRVSVFAWLLPFILVSYSLWASVWESVDDISSANILTFEDNVVVLRGKVMVNMRKWMGLIVLFPKFTITFLQFILVRKGKCLTLPVKRYIDIHKHTLNLHLYGNTVFRHSDREEPYGGFRR